MPKHRSKQKLELAIKVLATRIEDRLLAAVNDEIIADTCTDADLQEWVLYYVNRWHANNQ